MKELVFLTLFLGLTSGKHMVELQAAPAITSIRLEAAGQTLATLDHAPWTTEVDFGEELTPRELLAIGYDATGAVVARVSQVLNLPRPVAEVQIALMPGANGSAVAELVARHRQHEHVQSATLSVDGKAVSLGRDFRTAIPKLDWSRPHVLSAVVRFADGQVARHDTVLNGGYFDSVETELTPLIVRSSKGQPSAAEQCLTLDNVPVRIAAAERPPALVTVVKDPDVSEVHAKLHPVGGDVRPSSGRSWDEIVHDPNYEGMAKQWWRNPNLQYELRLSGDTTQRVLWPIASPFRATGEPTYELFPPSQVLRASKSGGMTWLLSRGGNFASTERRQFADAVAVAGVATLSRGTPGAVIYLLSDTPDASSNSPGAVRRYLETIGVPLHVWSLGTPSADATVAWGKIEDISTADALERAVKNLDADLASQKIVWVAAGALDALSVRANGGCGLVPVSSR